MKILFLLLLSLISFNASAKIEKFRLQGMAPDQRWDGSIEVDIQVKEWLDQAKDVAKATGRSVDDEIVEMINKIFKSQPASGVRAPDGRVRPFDSHHKILTAMKLLRQRKIPLDKVRFVVDVKEDFRGQ